MEAEVCENTQSLSDLPVPQEITSLKDLHFPSEQAAFDYYFEYARLHGFVARRGRSKKSQDGDDHKEKKEGAPLTFTAKDIYNFLDKDCLQMDSSLLPRRGDAIEVIKALKDKAEKDPKFFYQFTVNEDGRLEHLLWVHSQARSAARLFADVVLFDTTYNMNMYEMSFGVFVGLIIMAKAKLCYDGYDPNWILGKPLENLEIPLAPGEPDPANVPVPPDPATEDKKEEDSEEKENVEEEKKEEDTKGEEESEKKEEETEGEEKKEDGAKGDDNKEDKQEETTKEEPPAPPLPPDPVKLKVPFCCEACEEKVRAIFRVMSGVESVVVDTESGLVTITGNVQSEECLNLAKKAAKRAEIL
ncbi:hypothetical protein R1sor_008750 [Riccia sorocarpa]|uniref:HMA domain-containing protein n=1 Tax=Riccia sorocarpa TaxID=122646 RepID=A0ABD3HXS3_9MARC